ncbi:hypothetical protein ACIRP3_19395 [Streptomyces sp. NPDC101209]|uniref:hypothetical protein n=1 Tax=Streptomyces sp. NPDC101209 TaxID=3366129 RepID=UPI0037FCD8CA
MSDAEQDRAGRLRETGETAKAEATATADQARQAAGQVKETVAEQGKAVVGEARQQAGRALDDLRSRTVAEVEEQARRAAGVLRQWSDDIGGLADHAPGDSPARSVAAQISDRGHRAAGYLEKQGVDGVLTDLRDFARRRPGAFLGGALLAGLAVGRLAKVGKSAQSSSGQRSLPASSELPPESETAAPSLPPASVPQAPPVPPASVPQAPPVPPVPPAGAQPPYTGAQPSYPPGPAQDPPPIRPYPEV